MLFARASVGTVDRVFGCLAVPQIPVAVAHALFYEYMNKEKQYKLKDVSQNEDFLYWCERNGFVTLQDFFGLSLTALNKKSGFTPRMYKELTDLITTYNFEDHFPDFS